MCKLLKIMNLPIWRGRKKTFLVLLFLCFSVLSFSQAQLLDPRGDGSNWNANGKYDCNYLKARLSYLCEATSNSKYIRSFQRILKTNGEAVIESGEYVRKTCLSKSYDKEWVIWPNEATRTATNNINSEFPYIVYAYSTGDETAGYDVYYWVDDGDDDKDPLTNDDIIKPKLVGDARNLFQAGSNPRKLELLDLSGWDFSGVTNLTSFIYGTVSLETINFGTADFSNVTNISTMFTNCNLSSDAFQALVSSWVIDKTKLTTKNAEAKKHSSLTVTTANGVKYEIGSNGSFDNPLGGSTNMVIRNLDATQIDKNIRFNWDVVYESNGDVEKYTVLCLDDDKDWELDADKIQELMEVNPTDDASTVKSYMPLYTPENPREFDGTKLFKIKIKKTNGDIIYSEPFSITFDGLLPIELSYFTLSQDGKDLFFEWETATETNNDYFTIEQSIDGVSFYEIAWIAGAGTSSTSNFYEYSISTTFSGFMYFRLKQTDYNGDYSYSNIQAINVGNSEYIRLYPTIATDFITIEGDYESVKFSDTQGKIHHPTRMHGNSYPIAALPQGMHYAIISLKNGEIVTRQFFRK